MKAIWLRSCRRSRWLQVLLILGFWFAGDMVARMTGLPVPGAVLGLFLLLILLGSGKLDIGTVRRGAQLFLTDMLLFFIPAVLAVLDHPELLGTLGVKILAVILASTVVVMLVTAAVIDLCYRWLSNRKEICHGTD
jgi:holin-like protein